jgi:hypothetical protein
MQARTITAMPSGPALAQAGGLLILTALFVLWVKCGKGAA